jgi:hypothetical protein
MKAPAVVAAGVVIGCGLGLFVAGARLGFTASSDVVGGGVAQPEEATTTAQPKVRVDSEQHNFGVVEVDSLSSHAFKFTNEGDAPLLLTAGATSCGRCTVAEIPEAPIPPGGTVDVTVQYSASSSESDFRQTAWINTNDSDRPSVMLAIEGRIAQSFRAVPSDLNFSKVSSSESKSIELQLLGFADKSLEVLKHEFLEPESSDYFSAEFGPLPQQEWKDDGAKSGMRVAVTVKPGLPLGPIRQKIRLETNLDRNPVLEVPIAGTVVSDIEIFGPRGWDSDHNMLTIGPVKSREGAVRTLWVLVRGEHRQNVEVKTGSVEPNLLKVSVGSPSTSGASPVVRIPLTIEIPKGSPPVNFLGTESNPAAEIILETTHPEARRIKLFVRFAVES